MFLKALARKSVRNSSRKLSRGERMLSVKLGWPEEDDGAPSASESAFKGKAYYILMQEYLRRFTI